MSASWRRSRVAVSYDTSWVGGEKEEEEEGEGVGEGLR